jgi:hypothetical protein
MPFRHSLASVHVSPFSFLQKLAPSQETVNPEHIVVALVSSDPKGIFAQEPRLPATLHALHVDVHELVQQ